MIVILDTNIWKQELYLTSGASAALKLYLNRRGAIVALPEVIRLEIEVHLKTDVLKGRDDAQAAHGRLLALFGSLRAVQLPTDEQIKTLVGNFIADTGLRFRDVPFTLESARDSFLRTIDKRAPSSWSQQFKDGVLWADCKSLALEEDVILVTSDTAFYRNRKHADGLDEEVAHEIRQLPHSISVLPKLADLLEFVKTELRIDDAALITAIMASPLGNDIRAQADADELTLGSPKVSAKYFATENPSRVYVDFELSVIARDETSDEKGDAQLVLIGGCMLEESSGKLSDFGPRQLWMEYLPPSQLAGQRSTLAYMMGSTTRNLEHRVRAPLD